MFGFIHESIHQMMVRRFGDEFWQDVLTRTGFESGKENIVNHYYPDNDTNALVESVSALSKVCVSEMPREQVWEMYGAFLIEYTMEIGWDELLRTLSPNLKGFLDNLDSLHYFIDHVVYKANLRGPSFRCEEADDHSIVLHYFTSRPGLYPIVKGVVREVARRVFDLDINMSITGRTQRSVQLSTGERVEEHVVFNIKMNQDKNNVDPIPMSPANFDYGLLRITRADFCAAFPYHIIVDRDCKLVTAGNDLCYHISRELLEPGTPLIRIFEINRPQIPLDFENISNFINAVFVLQVRNSPLDLKRKQRKSDTSDSGSDHEFSVGQRLKLKGQMMLLDGKDHLIYLCSPYVTSIPELLQFGMRLSAMPLHDSTRDLILLNQQRLSDVEVNLQLEANNEQLEQLAKDLEEEKRKTDMLLKEMLPSTVAIQLMNGQTVEAREYEEATVMFTDVPNFQQIVPLCQPKEVVRLLNELFTKFDRLVTMHGVYKVETVGDSYMTVGGVPEVIEQHCENICHVALGMIWEARTVQDPVTNQPLNIRAGIHSGPIVAGVVGAKMPRYCLFGDTVNTASRMETHSAPGKIHCSEAAHTYAQKTGRFQFLCRGSICIRGREDMVTYFLKRSYKKSIWEIVRHSRDENVHSIDGYKELNNDVEDATLENHSSSSRTCTIS